MTPDPSRYRGFEIIVDPWNGRFLASFRDPLKKKPENRIFERLPDPFARDSVQRAVDIAEKYIDDLVAMEMSRVDVRCGPDRRF